jgi:hypothetical protein
MNLSNYANIYPNPANNFTVISWDNESVERIEIYNVVGTLVHYENTVGKSASRIEVGNLESGMYFINLKSANGTMTAKLMILD